jgi:hypothetical protein
MITTRKENLPGIVSVTKYCDSIFILILTDSWSCFKIKQVRRDTNGCGISYEWQQISLFVTWNVAGNIDLLFLPTEGNVQHLYVGLKNRLDHTHHRDPYEYHAVFAEEVRKLYDKSVSSLRDLIRESEKVCNILLSAGYDQLLKRDFSTCIQTRETRRHTADEFIRLYEVARHMSHSNETLDTAIDTIQSIKEEHREFSAERKHTGNDKYPIRLQVQRRLSCLSQDLSNIKKRSASLHERLSNEINLVSFIREIIFR